MKKFLILTAYFLVSRSAYAQFSPQEYVKNLTLVGVIAVEGNKNRAQSVAVIRDRFRGKTRILKKGEQILDAALTVRELSPGRVVLEGHNQIFTLRTDEMTSPSLSSQESESLPVETTEFDLNQSENLEEMNGQDLPQLPAPTSVKPSPEALSTPQSQRFEPPMLPEKLCGEAASAEGCVGDGG